MLRVGTTFRHIPRSERQKYDTLRTSKVDDDKLMHLRRKGLGYRRIAKQLGISFSTAKRHIQKIDLQSAKPSTT